MKQYEVNFEYAEQRFGDAILFAEDEDEATSEFMYYVDEFYPEADEIKITSLKEIIEDNGDRTD